MGILELLKGDKKSIDKEHSQIECRSSESVLQEAILSRGKPVRLDQCLKISLADAASFGTFFSELIPSFRTITVDGAGYIPVNMKPGDILKAAKDGTVWGTHIDGNGKSVLTKWKKAAPSTTVMPVDPSVLMVAAMLNNIDKKIDAISKTQKQILNYLAQDKQAEQEGNLIFLTSILTSYKLNWSNEQYRQNNHMKVLDIIQASEKNIVFFQKQITEVISDIPKIYTDHSIKEAFSKLDRQFQDYRFALYVFGFASFLEILLLGNFSNDYLTMVTSNINRYNDTFQSLIDQSREMMRNLSEVSVEAQVIAGIGNASKAIGKLIASSTLLSKGPVDEWLQEQGEKILKSGNLKAEGMTAQYLNSMDSGSALFTDSINNIDAIVNQTKEIWFDRENVYFA